MPLASLTGRLVGDRRGVIVLSLVALSFTLLFAFVADSPDAVGPTMLLPWVALFAFEAGPVLGLAAAAISFVLFLLAADGFHITPAFVIGRFAAFGLIGIGVGIAGARLRRSEQHSRRLVEGLPLVMYTEGAEGLTYISPQIEGLLGYTATDWLSQPDLWRTALHADDRERVLTEYTGAVDANAEFECTYRLVGADGRAVWVRDSST